MSGKAAAGAPGLPWRPYATLALVMLMWSGNFIVGRAVQGAIPPFTLALARWSGAAALLLPFAWPHVRADQRVLAANWRIVLLLGLTGVAAFNALIYSGLRFTTASNGLLLQAAIPALVLLFDRTVFGQRFTALQVFAVLLSMVGVALIVLRGDPGAILGLTFNIGDLMILAATACWAAYTSLLRLRPPCHPLVLLLATFAIGIAVMLPLSAWELAHGATIRVTPATVGAIVYVAVLPSLVAYILYNAAVRDLGAAAAGQTITLLPLFGALLAAALLDERLHAFHAVGMSAILGGIVLGALAGRRRLAEFP